jgi:hypothetical protein
MRVNLNVADPHRLEWLGSHYRTHLRLWAATKGTAQGLRHRAQGKNNKRKFIYSLCLAPYALCL